MKKKNNKKMLTPGKFRTGDVVEVWLDTMTDTCLWTKREAKELSYPVVMRATVMRVALRTTMWNSVSPEATTWVFERGDERYSCHDSDRFARIYRRESERTC